MTDLALRSTLPSSGGGTVASVTSNLDDVVEQVRRLVAGMHPSSKDGPLELDQLHREVRQGVVDALDVADLPEVELVRCVVRAFAPDETLIPRASVAVERWADRLRTAAPVRGAAEVAVEAMIVASLAGDPGLRHPDSPDHVTGMKAWDVPCQLAAAELALGLAKSGDALEKRTGRQVITSWQGRKAKEPRARYYLAAARYVHWQQQHRCWCHVCQQRPNRRHVISCWQPSAADSTTLEHWIDNWLVGARTSGEAASAKGRTPAVQVGGVRDGVFFRHFLPKYATDSPWILRIGEVLREVCAQEGCSHNHPAAMAHRITTAESSTLGPPGTRRCPADPTHPLAYSPQRLRDFVFLWNPAVPVDADPTRQDSGADAAAGPLAQPAPAQTIDARASHVFYERLLIDQETAAIRFDWRSKGVGRWVAQPPLPAWAQVLRASEERWRSDGLEWYPPVGTVPVDPRPGPDDPEDEMDQPDDEAPVRVPPITFSSAQLALADACASDGPSADDFIACLESKGLVRCTDPCVCGGTRSYCIERALKLAQHVRRKRKGGGSDG